MTFQKIKMINYNIMVALDDDDATIGSIHIPETQRELKKWGTLIAKSDRAKIDASVGDRVCVPWCKGMEMKIENKIYKILDENEAMLMEPQR